MNLGQATSASPPCSHLYGVTVESNTRIHLPQHFLMNIFKHGKVEEIEQQTPKYPPQAHSTISTLLSLLCHTPVLLSVHQIRLIFLMHHTHPCISPKHMVNTTVNLSQRIKPQFSFFVCEWKTREGKKPDHGHTAGDSNPALFPESTLYEDHPEEEMDTRHAETLMRQRQNSIQM